MIEYQIIVNVYQPGQGGRSIRTMVRAGDRNAAINKFNYLKGLMADPKRQGELRQWCEENLHISGTIQSLEGLYGVSYIQIL